MSYAQELELLRKDSEIPVEELRGRHTGGSSQIVGSKRKSALSVLVSDTVDGCGNDEEYEPCANMVDDETTIDAEEKLGREMSVEDEIAALKRDSEIPIESLLDLYSKANDVLPAEDGYRKRKKTSSSKAKATELESDDGLKALRALEASAEKAQKTRASRPYVMAAWVKLREYQQIGLNWLVSLQSRRLNGILADGAYII